MRIINEISNQELNEMIKNEIRLLKNWSGWLNDDDVDYKITSKSVLLRVRNQQRYDYRVKKYKTCTRFYYATIKTDCTYRVSNDGIEIDTWFSLDEFDFFNGKNKPSTYGWTSISEL